MSDGTKIEWTDATWNPITGCSVVSPGCQHCYAMKLAGTRLADHPSRAGLTLDTKAGPVWNGEVRFNEQWLGDPLRWRRPRMIFVCAHGDLFHEAVPDDWIDRVFAVMALAPQHTFQVLTKRAERMRAYMDRCCGRVADAVIARRRAAGDKGVVVPLAHIRPGAPWWPLSNVWLGVSAEDQQRADERIPHLLATPAAVRWVSAEPLLGALDLRDIPWPSDRRRFPETDDISDARSALSLIGGTRLDWVVAGGESGQGARPMHPDWARSLRDQCAAAGVPFFFKQWGEWAPNVGAVDWWTIDDDPEISRFDHREWRDGRWGDAFRPMWCDFQDGNYDQQQCVARLGKKATGRLLDGAQHDAMPEVGHAA